MEAASSSLHMLPSHSQPRQDGQAGSGPAHTAPFQITRLLGLSAPQVTVAVCSIAHLEAHHLSRSLSLLLQIGLMKRISMMLVSLMGNLILLSSLCSCVII